MEVQEILWLDPGHAFGIGNRTDPFITENFTQIDQYDFADTDLSRFACIVVHDFIDQEYMYKHREKIASFLDEGKIVIFAGHLFKEWLPGCSIFQPKKIHSFRDYEVSIMAEHPIFAGVKPEDMTYNKGVSGFFARGAHLPLPEHAEVLLALPDDIPITYIDRHSTNGTIFVHSGRDLFAYRNQNKSSDRISSQLLQWIKDEYEELKAAGGKMS